MVEKKFMELNVIEALNEISRKSDQDDELENIFIAAEGDLNEDDFVNESDVQVISYLSLAEIPIEQWSSISVSPLSVFADNYWNFTSYPCVDARGATVNFDYENKDGINVTSFEYKHWLIICKILCFYSLPHFSISSNLQSYGSIGSRKAKVFRIFELFKAERLYLWNVSDKNFRTLNDLSKDRVFDYINGQATPGMRWEAAFIIQFWQKISKAGVLPKIYSINENFVEKEDVSRYRAQYDDSCNRFAPIPLDDYAKIVKYCVTMVDDFGEDVLWLYQTYFPTLVGAYEHPDRMALRPEGVSTGSPEGVNAFRNYKPKFVGGAAWWKLRVLRRAADGAGFIDYSTVSSCVASLIDACCVLILATTGMRRSEVSYLRSGCVSRDEEGPWLTFTVFKTSIASQGDSKRIPIPEVTARAIALIERLFKEARAYGGHDFLFAVVTRQHFGNKAHLAYPERAVKRAALAAGVDENVHPHRFRKSLAMYMIYQDPQNIDIIRHLFSHRSLKMTLRYILSLPGVHTEIRKFIVEHNVELLSEIIKGIESKRIGGIGGNRVKTTIESSVNFKMKLQDDGKETLVQYVESLLDQGLHLLHRSNMAICLRNPALTENSPCLGKNEDTSTKLHPNIYACVPFNCHFAVFVENDIPALENEIIFHQRTALHAYSGEKQRIFSEQRIKDAFTRLSEIDKDHATQFMMKVING